MAGEKLLFKVKCFGSVLKKWTLRLQPSMMILMMNHKITEDIEDDKDANGLSDIERVSESSFIQVNDLAEENSNNSKTGDVGELIAEESLHAVNEQVQSLSSKLKERKMNGGVSNQNSTNTWSQKNNVGGSILEVMDELVKMNFLSLNVQGLGNKAKKGWIQELCHKHRINFVSIQETKMENIDLFSIKALWGNLNFDYVVGPSVGFSGGIVCVWDSSKFIKDHVSKSDYFVALMGTWSPTSTKLLIISVYAPQELTEKRDIWNYLCSLIDRWEGETVIMGDFIEVRFEHERLCTLFNRQGANAFINFISLAGLIDLPLEGYAYTWAHKSASKMSKLDRFLISEGLLTKFPHLLALCLDRHLSDHRSIIMRESSFDYGPTPFWIFHSWFSMEGLDTFVETTWKSLNVDEPNGLIRLKKKLQRLKNVIKVWSKETRTRLHERKINIHRKLSDVDKIIDQGKSNEEDQVEDLECNVTYDEVKRAVWDCGANKLPGPDGFTFEFFRKFWRIIDQDVFQDVFEFFENDAGFYKGISLNASFMISHLFYADDVVFVGEWNTLNIKTLTNVLKCFYLASGLKINFHKSKLMGVGVNSDEVNIAASMVGCSTFNSPFKYLGVKVGDNMSRINSWEEVINNVSTRLSKWKLKTLYIGGRLTLTKSVLSSIPLYHMSIFKVPSGVLNKLEAIRQNFFNGVECSEKKLLGLVGIRSPWLDIIQDLHSLKSKGIDLMQFIRKKVGNGENTSFWDENWTGDDIFKNIYPRLYALEENKSISVADKLCHSSLVHTFRRLPRGGVEEVQLDSLRTHMSDVILPNMADHWI
ncbi:RNA-directed DNA polymerase, eukaryota [Tanacetum coccineum]